MKRILFFFVFVIFMASLHGQIENTKGNISAILNNATISVTIGGDFPVTGSFPALINERVDQFITRIYIDARTKAIGSITDPETLKRLNEKLNNFSFRGIIIKRSSGESITIDLQKFRLNGDFKNNPYLKNDDVIIFPPSNIEINFFRISGAVNYPARYPFVEGDKLFDAIELAQGINPAYKDVKHVEINRLSYDGQTMTKLEVNLDTNIPLQRGDRITIIADETQKKDFSALVVGEVHRPGKIGITKHTTTLRNLIEMAGGIRQDASLKRAKLYSGRSLQALIEKEYEIKIKDITELTSKELEEKYMQLDYNLMSRMSNLTEVDTAYFLAENQIRLLNETGSIDFTKLDDTTSEESKYIVNDGDIIIIPKQEKVVYVFGQVTNPGRVNFVEDKDYKYYINQAGGLGEFSDDDVMLIKGSSRKWISLNDNNINIEDGDYIYIPKNPKRSFKYYISLASDYLSIVGSVATIILLLIQINK